MLGLLRDKSTDQVGGSARTPAVAALDLGQSKVACFIMKPDGVRRADNTIRVAGAGHVQSKGVRGGVIVNMEDAADSIVRAVERAERASGVTVSGVVVTSAIGQMASHRVTASVSLGGHPISDPDLVRAISAALSKISLPNRRPIHVLPVAWSVDGSRGVHDPRHLKGKTLGLDLLVISMAESAFGALSNCLERAHLDLQGVAAAPLVTSLAALEEDEMELGSVCIDMGAGTTSAAVWGGRSLLHIESVSVGGDHVTADIARGMTTSRAGAERLKTLHGSAMASNNEDREMVEAPPRGEDGSADPVVWPRAMLKTIIAPRVEETLELMRDRLKANGVRIDPGMGIVLTGGASQLNGVRELAERVFDHRSVRLGRPQRAPHLAAAAAGPAFCSAAGVLLRAAYGPREAVSAHKLMTRHVTAADAPRVQRGGTFARAAIWLRENF